MAPSDRVSARRLDARAVRAALDRLAARPEPPWLHVEVARRMAERLALIRVRPARVVDWWSWLGAGSALLGAAYPEAARSRIEPTPRLAERSRERSVGRWWSAWRRAGGPIEVQLDSDPPTPGAGLVWANMVLHHVVDPPALMARWQRLLDVDGFVMFSCLGPGTLRELRALYAAAGWPPPTPGFVDMHDLGDMLIEAGFADPVMDQETLDLRFAGPQALLDELRSLGGNTAPDRAAGLRTPRWRDELVRGLDALRGSDGKLGLGFEVAYGHAFKAAPRPGSGGETSVALDDMRAMLRSTRPGRERLR